MTGESKVNLKKNVLLVGENPELFTGNGNMMLSCMEDIDKEKFRIAALLQGQNPIYMLEDPFSSISPISDELNIPFIPAYDTNKRDVWGKEKLLSFLANHDVDILMFVGLDIWRFNEVFDSIQRIQQQNKFIWKAVVPYDLDHIRDDWIAWLKYPDQVYIYSEFGYNMVKDLPNVQFFRPRPVYADLFQPGSEDDKKNIRRNIFPDVTDDTTIFFYLGNNQLRKNIYNMLAGFAEAYKQRKDMILYLHLDSVDTPLSIERICSDLGLPDGAVRHNANSRKLYPVETAALIKGMDCHVLWSLQEGLSWTVIETKLSGIPSIVSDTTAHKDFGNKQGIIYTEQDEFQLLPLMTSYGAAYVRVRACSSQAISRSIMRYLKQYKDKNRLQLLTESCYQIADDWMNKCGNFNDVLEDLPNSNTELGEIL